MKLLISALVLAGFAAAQTPTPLQTQPTAVLAILTVRNDSDRPKMVKIMHEEVTDTVKLYLDGKIQQWYSRGDGKGVVFIMNCKTVDEAKAITDTLPLVKNNYVTFDYMVLGPLGPLRYLMDK